MYQNEKNRLTRLHYHIYQSCLLVFICLMIPAFAACGKNDSGEASGEEANNVLDTSHPVELTVEKRDGDSATNPDEVVESNEDEITIIMVGDMLLHDGLEDYAKQEDGSWDYSSFFTHTKDLIADADLAIANQEVILGGEELRISGYPNFNGPYEFGDELVNVGFDLILHGTNHALDRGASGISNCLNYWETRHPEIGVLGIHEDAEDYNDIYIYEENGIRVAVLNYTYGTNGIALPYEYSVELLNEEKVVRDIAWAEEHADFTICCPHWGTEYNLGVSSQQNYWTKVFLESGVDLVIGTHPHVIEPIEWIEDEESGHRMLVYYSLGNYINWTAGTGAGTSDRMVGGMASVTIGRDEDGNVEIIENSVIPLICHLTEEEGELTVYPADEYSDSLGQENAIRLQDSNFSYDYCKNLIDNVWNIHS